MDGRMIPTELRSRLDFAIQAARHAGNIAMSYFHADVTVERKADDSPVTDADRRAEREMREMIAKAFPDDAVLGEEFGETGGNSGWRWILDPIDGTQSFIRGVPLFGVLIGVEFNGKAVIGVVYMPALGELVYAAEGDGCFWHPAGSVREDTPRRARVSSVGRLADGLVVTTSYEYWLRTGTADVFCRIADIAMTRGWSDCYAHVLVATGRAEAAIEPGMSIWDSAPFLPILTEAGGTYTDWNGMSSITANQTISSNGKVIGEVLKLIAG
jgi:histidinol phosphatase-like enzyme (inositol monophosphatase family)